MRLPFRVGAILLSVSGSAIAATYDVGPAEPLQAIGDVPLETLAPGDLVRIHWRATPYREKWVIGRSGTRAAPIVVQGVPGPNGERPVVSGDGATTRQALDFWNEERGLIKIGGSSIPPQTVPEWIVVQGLELRSAHASYGFTDDRGNPQTYAGNAAGLYVEYGRNITVRDCELHDNGNGIFMGSPAADPTRDILIERNSLHSNGNVGSAFEHNSYTTTLGIVFQDNHYGPLRPGADGNNLKDRSGGLVVRYNWIEAGNRQLDLVDSQLGSVIEQDPAYRLTHVYGNVLIETEGAGNRQMVHYGGDGSDTAAYRKGTLHFYANTVISERAGFSTLFRLSTGGETADARNNVVFLPNATGDQLELVSDAGTLDWTHNYLEPGWSFSFFGTTGLFNDAGTTVEGTDPGFVDGAGRDFHLLATSAMVDAGTVLHADALPANDVVRMPTAPLASAPRPVDASLDIGAFELARLTAPAEVFDLMVVAGSRLSWPLVPTADSYDVIRGDLSSLRTLGVGGSLLGCLASGLTATEVVDVTALPPSGAIWYLVRARNAAGAGTWGSARDAAIASSPATCP